MENHFALSGASLVSVKINMTHLSLCSFHHNQPTQDKAADIVKLRVEIEHSADFHHPAISFYEPDLRARGFKSNVAGNVDQRVAGAPPCLRVAESSKFMGRQVTKPSTGMSKIVLAWC